MQETGKLRAGRGYWGYVIVIHVTPTCGYDKGFSWKCPNGDVKDGCHVPREGGVARGVGWGWGWGRGGECKFLEARGKSRIV